MGIKINIPLNHPGFQWKVSGRFFHQAKVTRAMLGSRGSGQKFCNPRHFNGLAEGNFVWSRLFDLFWSLEERFFLWMGTHVRWESATLSDKSCSHIGFFFQEKMGWKMRTNDVKPARVANFSTCWAVHTTYLSIKKNIYQVTSTLVLVRNGT